MKRAIVLAGGGAKGSYQLGFWKAIKELGIDFQIVTGSSVGALNGAMMASGFFEESSDMWNSIVTEDIVETKPTKLSQIIDTESIAPSIKPFLGDLTAPTLNLKMDPFPLKKLIAKYLDEKALRESKIDFGLMTSEYPSMRPHPVTIKDIPYGMLSDYLLASSTVFPSMDPKEIAGKRFVDGGYSDNFPVNLALDMGAKEIIGVELGATGLEAKYETDFPIRVIRSKFSLGPTMTFSPETAKRNISLGYNDTMKSFGRLEGDYYTFKIGETEKMQKDFEGFCVEVLAKCGSISISEKNEYQKSLAIKGFSDKRGHRPGLMKEDLALVCCETAAELFLVDPTEIYSYESIRKAVLDAFKPYYNNASNGARELFTSQKPLTYKLGLLEKLDRKDFTAFLLEYWEEFSRGEDRARDLKSICRFAPIEFFASLYISFLLKKENQNEEN